MLDLVRDSTFGQIVNWASNGRLLPYPDQRSDYVIPDKYLPRHSTAPGAAADSPLPRTVSQAPTLASGAVTLVDAPGVCQEHKKVGSEAGDVEKQLQDVEAPPALPPSVRYPWLVDWEENDPDRPLNWSPRKRLFVASLVMLLTFSVYVGSAIYTPSIPGIMEEFGIGQVGATSGLTLFVAAYGVGPMLLSPMQEIPRWGRTPVYIIGLALFVIFQIPQVLAKNVATVLVFRFLSGFVGSPALATGGASMADIYPPRQLAYAVGAWSIGAVCGPIAGPVIGGFAAEGENWRWPLLELLWISGFAFVALFFFLPETMESTVLVRRAERLRKLTGNPLLKAPAEVDQGDDDRLGKLLKETISRAFRLALEPSLAVAHGYIALVYAIFYLWFESFSLTFNEIHHFSLGIGGLPYLAFVVSAAITFTFYVLYQKYHMNPRADRDPNLQPEARLEIALYAAPFIPASLLLFGWSARESVHWIVPVIGAGLYLPGIFLAFQGIMVYVSMSYPRYAASILAGNDLFRSTFASVFPLFGTKYFNALTIGGGSTLLAGISILMMPLLYLIMKYGPVLRARSSFAQG
ncbi:putative caffeine resistance protein [Rhodotorula diobovata]|uniref:Putative caffeine resistance protein n=1 Tax=Rhodotorula diobovata TaxID=5288 RepID=A0A5C5G853_9BASI|nr:putative caffeine resistance protein [Rhodotorula diobovata]